MFLVAGLAVAGLVGIAAAFYFSIRSGNRGDKRLRSAGAGRAGTARRPGSRSSTTRPDLTGPDLNGHSRRPADGTRPVTTFRPAASPRPNRAEAGTGTDPAPDYDVLAGSRRAGAGATATRGGGRRSATRAAEPVAARRTGDRQPLPEDAWPDDPMPGDPAATDPKLSAVDRTTKPRRRVGFRKGADLDEELWPAETFGGVSDEQFWDDLASDKPLATTARTAQQEPPSKDRLSGPAPGSGLATGPAPGLDTGPATDPQAAERTAIQPAYAATQPVQGMKPPPGATQPVRVAASSSQPMSAAGRPGAGSQPREVATPPYGTAAQPREAVTPPRGTATPPRGTAAQPREAITPPRGTATPPAGTRRRRPSSAEEDPLTSAAFSLRPKGPVDGRSSLRARNGSADRYDSGASTGSHAGTSAYPSYSAPSYGDPSSQTQTMSTPPYGQNYGYGNSGPAAPPSEPRRRNGSGSHARPEDAAGVTRPVRQAYPRGSHQATGSHRSNGSYPGNGSPLANSSSQGPGGYPGSGYPANGYPGSGYQGSGYQGNGHRGNGHRAPYDPRDDYRRLTHQY